LRHWPGHGLTGIGTVAARICPAKSSTHARNASSFSIRCSSSGL
jgi:hypothetical protein